MLREVELLSDLPEPQILRLPGQKQEVVQRTLAGFLSLEEAQRLVEIATPLLEAGLLHSSCPSA